MRNKCLFGLLVFVVFSVFSCTSKKGPNDFERKVIDKNPSFVPLSPQESISKVQLPPGFRLELVASEPMVQEPVALAWDPNGRMYVVEMNTYMEDATGTGQFEPTSRIKLLEDTDGDGKMDKFTIFADSLILPRAILPLADGLLVDVTNDYNIWKFRDTDNDGKADEQKLVYNNPEIDLRNLEHQNGGFIRNMDNWIYPTRDNLRYRYRNGKLQADTMINNMTGQWGITTDNYGRLFFSEAGPGLPAVQIQQMPHYGVLNFKDQYTEDFTVPWPVIGTLDAQGGPDALRPEDNTLNHLTAVCGQSIFRGDRLPADMQGDYFVAEPVGRIIKRGRVVNTNGKIQIQNVYQGKDWLASADPNFRPLNTYTGPDGCFYIVDMYHGIIQESEWSGPGTYLGGIIKDKELYKNRGMGRIYRIVHDDFEPDPKRPAMLNESAAQLLKYLDHPNGWWRDNAQMMLISRNNKSVIPALKQIALGEKSVLRKKPNDVTRVHALWTLEGMNAIDKATLFKALEDKEPQVRKAAVWIAEMFGDDEEVIGKLGSMVDDPGADVRVQLALSLRGNPAVTAQQAFNHLLSSNPQNELMQRSYASHKKTLEDIALEESRIKNISPAERNLVLKGATIYKQLCATCHGPDGRGKVVGDGQLFAPALAGSPRMQGEDRILPIEIMMHGLKGPIDGKTYKDMMPSMVGQSNEWIAAVLSYVRNSGDLGNKASVITAEEVEKVRDYLKPIPGGASLQQLEITRHYRALKRNFDE